MIVAAALAGGEGPPPVPRPCCQRCQSRPSFRRGICKRCYKSLGRAGRAAYTSGSAWAYDRIDLCRRRRLPRAPTSARPGSDEKLAVMALRYARRESLFHPQDAGVPD